MNKRPCEHRCVSGGQLKNFALQLLKLAWTASMGKHLFGGTLQLKRGIDRRRVDRGSYRQIGGKRYGCQQTQAFSM